MARSPLGLIGPGTGLGVSGLLPADGGRSAIPINGEGGHVTLAGTTPLEDAVIARLRERFGHASAERAVSGPGLVNLHRAVRARRRRGRGARRRRHQRPRAGGDARAVQAVELFFAFLGTVAGNPRSRWGRVAACTLAAASCPGSATASTLPRSASASKPGRFRDYLRGIPTFVVQASTSPALLRAARALEDL